MLLRALATGRRSVTPTGRAARRRPAGLGRALAVAMPLLLAPLAVAAQDLSSLADQVQRLQRDLADLQSTVYSGAPAPAGAASSGGSNLDASQEVRLQQLQGEMSGLTGRIEELGYQMQRLQERVDVLANAVGEIMRGERQPGQPGGQAAGTPMADAGTAGTAAPGAAPGAAAGAAAGTGAASAGVAPPAGAPAPDTLGTLTQSQLEAAQSELAQNGTTQNGMSADTGQSAASGAAPQLTPPQTAATAPATPYVLPGNTPDEQYQYAFGLLRQANYAEAERALTAFIERNPASSLAGNAQYWLGETHYVRGDYQKAAVAFAEGYKNYPESGKAPDNLLKLGMSLGEIGATKDACTTLGQLAKEFPGAPANIKERAAYERQRLGC